MEQVTPETPAPAFDEVDIAILWRIGLNHSELLIDDES